MNTTVQTFKPSFNKWQSHFRNMSNGNAKKRKNKIVSVKTVNQSGSGVELVTPASQVVHMAEAKKKKVIKRKVKSTKPHSASGAQRVNISKPKKGKRKSKKKSVKRKR